MKIYTIGFTQKSAQHFFELLNNHSVECLVDIRLYPDSQLAGFAKQRDLPYLLEKINRCAYRYLPELAPSDELLKTYRKNKDWDAYVIGYQALMDERKIPASLDRSLFENKRCCLLCSEALPERCHRRLAAERIQKEWPGVEIIHLG